MVGTGLGIELVGIADNLFLQCLRLIARQASACMALCDPGMTREALSTKDLSTDGTMFDIRFRTITKDRRSITTEDANVMEHRRLLYELAIDGQFPVFVHNKESTVGDLPTVL
jgi:hypothetical protein